jgi:hypothetical protein
MPWMNAGRAWALILLGCGRPDTAAVPCFDGPQVPHVRTCDGAPVPIFYQLAVDRTSPPVLGFELDARAHDLEPPYLFRYGVVFDEGIARGEVEPHREALHRLSLVHAGKEIAADGPSIPRHTKDIVNFLPLSLEVLRDARAFLDEQDLPHMEAVLSGVLLSGEDQICSFPVRLHMRLCRECKPGAC